MIIHKSVTVARPPDIAFKLFVEEMAQWWPIDKYTFLGEGSVITMEPRVGGRFFERTPDGREYTIGEVLRCEPGTRLTYTWNHGEGEGTTEIDIRFTAEDAGTRVHLAHSGWERVADDALAARYEAGWDDLLRFYLAYAGTPK